MTVTALLGLKGEMSQIFRDDGEILPVTILQVGPCTVTQVKTPETDGYNAVQLGYGAIKASRVKNPLKGHFKKANTEARRTLKEVRLKDKPAVKAGDIIKVGDVFKQGDWVDVIGMTKGRGFQGGVKRYGFYGGPGGHGTKFMREPGSSGTNTSVAHVLKGKRMALERNGEIVPRSQFDKVALADGDALEIVVAVGGG